jgi:hypothetical protein
VSSLSPSSSNQNRTEFQRSPAEGPATRIGVSGQGRERQGRLARAGSSRALKDNRIRVGPARHRRLGKRAHGPKDSEAWGVESGLEHPWH